MPAEITEAEIQKYYAKAGATNVFRVSRDAADVEFSSKQALIEAIDLGTSTFSGKPFFIRTSYHNQRAVTSFRGGRGRGRGGGDRQDRGDRERRRYDSVFNT